MKKYIRSKNAVAFDLLLPNPRKSIKEELVQPPLPPDPPSPYKSPNVGLTLHEEVKTSKYTSPGEESSIAVEASELTDKLKNKVSDDSTKSRTICRDFIRGICTRLGTCNFSHNCTVPLLAGVYTFCNDFQNNVCTRLYCKYVHATVFEEQHFYRTGELSPHAFAHHKKVNLLPPPPPPPPPQDPPVEFLTVFNVPPPPLPVSVENPTFHMSNMTAGNLDPRAFPDDFSAASSSSCTSPLPDLLYIDNYMRTVFQSPPPPLPMSPENTMSYISNKTTSNLDTRAYPHDPRAVYFANSTSPLEHNWLNIGNYPPVDIRTLSQVPPPPLPVSPQNPTSLISNMSAGKLDPRAFLGCSSSPLKRKWQNIENHSSKCKRAGVEDFTNQPTCHSNKMKKYIRSKNAVAPDSPPLNPKMERANPAVQPPLPLDPPPPDKPPNMALTLKEEVEDVEYASPGEESSDAISSSELTDDYKNKESDSCNKSTTMCRDFIRGKCTRLGTCKFSHKCDVSQLAGVYTFCNDFQNSVCTRPNCKYVHATVFEEQHFYRTGELPPHAFAHHKKVNLLPPPPPPPEDPPADIQTVFKVPPPPLPVSAENPPSLISNMTPGKLDSRAFPDELRSALSASSSSPLKSHDWPNIGNFGNSSCDMQHEPDHMRKRCRNCDLLDLRVEFMTEKLDKIRKARLERRQAMEILARKRERLDTTLSMLRPTYQGNLGGGMSTSQNNTGERQQWLLDQFKNALTNNLITGIQEETNRNALTGNLNASDLLSKLLNAYARQNISDATRNT